MITKYHLTVKLIFDNATDRDAWAGKLKTASANLKQSNPVPSVFYIERDEQVIMETVRENL